VTPRPSFDLLAAPYQLLERLTFGPLLHRCRTAHLDRVRDRRRALILGDGDGRFLADLLRANPDVRADSVDISPGMLAAARRRVRLIAGATERVRFVCADVRSDSLPDSDYDLVVTNFVLDCFRPAELAAVVSRLASACAPGALWLDGDFRLPAAGWERLAARAALAGMYAAFRLVTRMPNGRLTDPAPLQRAAGFRLEAEAAWLRDFLSARLWTADKLNAAAEARP
jgi:SAM-dependent methyltransferase